MNLLYVMWTLDIEPRVIREGGCRIGIRIGMRIRRVDKVIHIIFENRLLTFDGVGGDGESELRVCVILLHDSDFNKNFRSMACFRSVKRKSRWNERKWKAQIEENRLHSLEFSFSSEGTWGYFLSFIFLNVGLVINRKIKKGNKLIACGYNIIACGSHEMPGV